MFLPISKKKVTDLQGKKTHPERGRFYASGRPQISVSRRPIRSCSLSRTHLDLPRFWRRKDKGCSQNPTSEDQKREKHLRQETIKLMDQSHSKLHLVVATGGRRILQVLWIKLSNAKDTENDDGGGGDGGDDAIIIKHHDDGSAGHVCRGIHGRH